jgi:hypothetical protein
MTPEKITTVFDNGLLACVGGFIGTMAHYIASVSILLNLNFHELLDFTVHSIIGGLIMLAIKLANDGIASMIKKHLRRKKTTLFKEMEKIEEATEEKKEEVKKENEKQ